METQPILLGCQFLIPYFFGPDEQIPSAAAITFLLLGFHWWAMWSNSSSAAFRTAWKTSGISIVLYHAFALMLAFGLLVLTDLALLDDVAMLILLLILIGWAWKRGQNYTRADMEEEQLVLAFKIGFIALLIVMVFALLNQALNIPALSDSLLLALPLFFLSGVLTLAFSRLSMFQKEQVRNSGNARRAITNAWAVIMTVTWAVLVALSIGFEELPPYVLQTLFSPFWYLLNLLVSLLLDIFGLLARLFPTGSSVGQYSGPPTQPRPPVHQRPLQIIQHASNQLVLIRTLTEIIIVVLVLFVLLALILKNRRRVILTGDEEEIREDLDRGAILKERRAQRAERQQIFTLEPLEPLSARMLYREFLLALASRDEQLQRHADETPVEYKERLLTVVTSLPMIENQDTPSSHALLEELTQAYINERYGARHLAGERLVYLRQWMPTLVQCLTQPSKNNEDYEA